MASMLKNALMLSWLALSLWACSGSGSLVGPRTPGIFHDPFDRMVKTFLGNKEKISGKKIAVCEFPDISGRVEPEGKLVAERLTTKLVQTEAFEVIERSRLESVLTELKLSASGVTDEETAMHAGKILGAGAIMTGTVARIKNRFEINARIINVETGEVLSSAMAEIDDDSLRVIDDGPQPPAPATQTTVIHQSPPLAQPKEPPAGWELWPGWDNSYGSFKISDGRLFYYLGSRQHDHAWADTAPKDGYFRGLILAKPLQGKKWTIELKANYTLPWSSGRWFSTCIWIGKEGIRPSLRNPDEDLGVCLFKRADQTGYGSRSEHIEFHHQHGTELLETPRVYENPGYFRFTRNNDVFKLDISENGTDYRNIMNFRAAGTLDGKAQKLVFGGQSAGGGNSYAEYEYIKINGRRETF